MEESLSKGAFKEMKAARQTGAPLDSATADVVAAAMKDWAIAKGVKFFSHIFYPLTNITAEKHDGFIVINSEGHAITEFTGSLLIKGEPDGSSFPNGSLRTTNAARGYTSWDPTSPAYVMNTANGAPLMIPSVFMSWTGESLDKKIPLLRSSAARSRSPGSTAQASMSTGQSVTPPTATCSTPGPTRPRTCTSCCSAARSFGGPPLRASASSGYCHGEQRPPSAGQRGATSDYLYRSWRTTRRGLQRHQERQLADP